MKQISMCIGNVKVTGSIGHPLKNTISRYLMCNHVVENGTFNIEAFDTVDWNGLDTITKILSTCFRLWTTEHVSGFCAVNKILFYRNTSHLKICPWCGKAGIIKNTRPQVHCTDPNREFWWKKTIQNLNTWLHENGIDPRLTSTIIAHLLRQCNLSFSAACHPAVNISYAQDDITWDTFVESKSVQEIRTI